MRKNNCKYIIGVSGGPDSMCLLDKYKNKVKAVCHVNYHMRKTAKRDELIVKNFCKKNHLNLFIKNCFFSKEKKINNFQDWARKKRYDFMTKIAEKFACNTILVAHHLNDFVETALMQMQRKSKTLFLGINKFSNYKNYKIYRPLLKFKKQDLIEYCDLKNSDYGIDETNFDSKYLRNKIRLEISKWNQTKFNNFYQEIIKFNNENKKTRVQVEKFYKNWKDTKDTKELLKKPETFIFYILYKFLLDNEINASEKKISMIIVLMKKNNPNKLFRLGNGLFLYCKNKKIIIDKNKKLNYL